PLGCSYPVIPCVAAELMSTSAIKIASAPRPMIPPQPVQGNDIKLPKVTIPKIKTPKIKALKIIYLKMP
ncbi:hypothetical protein BGZ91_003789, partial [Linnemannia elongata]